MSKILTTSDLQKNIGMIAKDIDTSTFIVTNRGRAKMVILPYFDENEGELQEYLEAYEMQKNKQNLKKRYAESWQSGISPVQL